MRVNVIFDNYSGRILILPVDTDFSQMTEVNCGIDGSELMDEENDRWIIEEHDIDTHGLLIDTERRIRIGG